MALIIGPKNIIKSLSSSSSSSSSWSIYLNNHNMIYHLLILIIMLKIDNVHLKTSIRSVISDSKFYSTMESCCQYGQQFGEHCHQMRLNDIQSQNEDTSANFNLCKQMKQLCCEERSRWLQCNRGKHFALRPIFGNNLHHPDDGTQKSMTSGSSCQQLFNDINQTSNQFEAFHCCKECQMAIHISIQLSYGYEKYYDQNVVCQMYSQMINKYTTSSSISTFNDCCQQMTRWIADRNLPKTHPTNQTIEKYPFNDNQPSLTDNNQPINDGHSTKYPMDISIQEMKELMESFKNQAEDGLPINTISHIDDYHQSTNSPRIDSLSNSADYDPITKILDLNEMDNQSQPIATIEDLDFTDKPLIDADLDNDNELLAPNDQTTLRCLPGFQIDPLDGQCKDINECQLGTHNCHEALRCDNTIGSFLCVRIVDCGTGYTINADTYECDDIDECALNIHHCGPDYRCRNTQGSFKCDRIRCPPGQALVNGFCRRTACRQADWIFDYQLGICQPPQDPCASNPCREEERCLLRHELEGEMSSANKTDLIIQNWTYYCVPLCHNGYRFNFTEMKCTDIDECNEGISRCSSNQYCINTEGYYNCECLPGYEFDNRRRKCLDVNECLRGEVMLECSTQTKTCVNIPGSYRCECGNGLYWDESQGKCMDRDECLPEWNRCEQICVNTIGSYECRCHQGYRLMVNKHNCTDIDECKMNNMVHSYHPTTIWPYNPTTMSLSQSSVNLEGQSYNSPCRGICINDIGSYHCECPLGFRLSQQNSHRCLDINECEELDRRWQVPCLQDPRKGHCINLYGSYKCVQIDCPQGFQSIKTKQSIRCRWKGLDQRNQTNWLPKEYYHEYDYLYYTIYKNQTKFLLDGVSSMYLYTIRLDNVDHVRDQRPHFQLRLLSSEWLPVMDVYNRHRIHSHDRLFDDIVINPPSSTKQNQQQLAQQGHFQLKINRDENEANVNIVWPLDGPQKIQLEFIATGFRLGQYVRQRSILTLFVSQFDQF